MVVELEGIEFVAGAHAKGGLLLGFTPAHTVRLRI